MDFLDIDGKPLIKSLKAKIRAFKKLKDADIKINSFNDNGNFCVQCVDVIDELKWLFKKAVQFSSNKNFYPTRTIEDTAISESPRLIKGLYDKSLCDNEQLKKPLKNYQDLNSAIVDRMYWVINKAMSKEVEKVVEKPVTKSIDTNTFYTTVVATFAIGGCFLTQAFNTFGNFITGTFVCVIALLMISYKRAFFENPNSLR